MTVTQARFRNAVLNSELPAPEGLQDPAGRPAGARFSVYRNNVVVSLSEALVTAFPLVRKLLGAQSFGRLAGLYVRAAPPSSPLMMHYGEGFPDFLNDFEPLRHIGYLPDCARLDVALRASYHAADATPLDPSVFAGNDQDVGALQLRLAPSSRILRSRWPLYDIWRFNTEDGAPKPRAVAQDVLITRPDFDPIPHLLPAGAADWFDRLSNATPFDKAADETVSDNAAFDLQESLTLALRTRALIHTTAKES